MGSGDFRRLVYLVTWCLAAFGVVIAQEETGSVGYPANNRLAENDSPADGGILTLDQLKAEGARRSGYLRQQQRPIPSEVPKPKLAAYRKGIEPILQSACMRCHGPDLQEGNLRIDSLDPDLVHGEDVPWWLEVFAVLSNGEMPPPEEVQLTDENRSRIVDWLSSEIQTASEVRHAQQSHSSFRRMTRYEYNYALQDLLGLPYDFAKDLPPDANSEDGFQNSSELLHMSAVQLATYRELGRKALRRATARGEQPLPLHWGVSMQAASATEWEHQEAELDQIRQAHKNDPAKLNQELEAKIKSYQARHGRTYYKDLSTARTAVANWSYPGAKFAWKPHETKPAVPQTFSCVVVIPPRQRFIVELGDRIPEKGTLRVRVRASRSSFHDDRIPSLQLEFGWQASNDSHASVRISDHDLAIDAPPNQPKYYQWDVPLSEIYPRNSVRNVSKLGDLPSPSEYVKFVNRSVSHGDVQIDYVEITAPVYESWPPASHRQIFIDSKNKESEQVYAQEILRNFMSRAWRRPVTDSEIDQKLALLASIRPQCEDFEDAMIEVLASVIASPKFLYLIGSDPTSKPENLTNYELATRLSTFLWCSVPDHTLLQLASEGRLRDPKVLESETKRMLADERSRRFSEHFVYQWLGMQLLDYLKVDRKEYPGFDPSLKEALQEEPIAFFHEVLQHNQSVIDFLHADFTMANERLAQHYGLNEVFGNYFRRVELSPQQRRGGLLTQAGLLAMNSDGKDSHPLKRGIWLLERLLDDPPPPPPPAVPRIDLADPEIAKLTLKQRMANHREQAACRSCHRKIDPWGLALENFDAIGGWRNQVRGQPVDATSVLFNNQELDGVDGLKRFLLEHRQDQFARALVHKMTTYALGRPLSFADRAEIDRITANLRQQGDGLATMIELIVKSDLFQSE
jgi:mono/diheme cytochrome c family protein